MLRPEAYLTLHRRPERSYHFLASAAIAGTRQIFRASAFVLALTSASEVVSSRELFRLVFRAWKRLHNEWHSAFSSSSSSPSIEDATVLSHPDLLRPEEVYILMQMMTSAPNTTPST
jgi:hypothetical protein